MCSMVQPLGMPADGGRVSEAQPEEAVTKYLLIYQGQLDGLMPELSEEESDPMMQAWQDWMGRVGGPCRRWSADR